MALNVQAGFAGNAAQKTGTKPLSKRWPANICNKHPLDSDGMAHVAMVLQEMGLT